MKLPIEEFLKRRKDSKPAYVFDLREMEEYEKDHLAGAYNLPFEHLESNLARLPFSGDMLFYDGGEGVGGLGLRWRGPQRPKTGISSLWAPCFCHGTWCYWLLVESSRMMNHTN